MKNKKVLIDCERMKYPYTGLYEYCSQLSKALVKITPANNELTFYVPQKEVGFLGNEQHYIIQHSRHKFFNPHAAKFDIWHGTFQGSMYYPNQKKIKKLLTVHDLNFLYDERISLSNRKKYLKKLQEKIDRSDQLTAISNFTLQSLKDNLRLDGVPAEVIYNGCNVDLIKNPMQKPAWIKDGKKYLFTVSTIAVKKNFHVLPALLAGNDYKLVIAGIIQDHQYFGKIIGEAKKYKVQDRMIIPGPVTQNEKWWLMAHAGAFVFPSVAEGFGIPVIEAMNFGVPVLLSTHTCLPEIGADAAYYFKSFDPYDMQQTLKDSMAHFSDEPNQAEKMKQRARLFNWDKAANQYLDLYEKL